MGIRTIKIGSERQFASIIAPPRTKESRRRNSERNRHLRNAARKAKARRAGK